MSRKNKRKAPFHRELGFLIGDQYGIRIRECYRERVVC